MNELTGSLLHLRGSSWCRPSNSQRQTLLSLHMASAEDQHVPAMPAAITAVMRVLYNNPPVVIRCDHIDAGIQQVVDRAAVHLSQATKANLV